MGEEIVFSQAQHDAVEAVVRRALRCGLPGNVRADDVRQVARLAILQAMHDDPFRVASIGVSTFIRAERRYATRHPEITPAIEDAAVEPTPAAFDVTPFLDGLGFEERLALQLRYLQSRCWDDVGAALGMEPAAARMMATRTIERLKFG